MRYEMTDEQLKKILEACKPVPYIVADGREPISPQEHANAAWAALGAEMGFDWKTVSSVPGESHVFVAEELR